MFRAVLATEFLKLRRCKVTWLSLAALSLGPCGIALFMWIVREPGRAAQLGLLGAKADLVGFDATWPTSFSVLALVVGIGGMLVLSFIVAWVFGREYADATAKNMLALPVGRHIFVLAKLVVVAAWWAVLVAAVLAEAMAIGLLLDLPGLTADLAIGGVRNALLAAGVAFLLAPAGAWITTAGRGYMPPLAFALAMLALGNLFARTGWAVWFPWSIAPLLVGMMAKPAASLPPGSYVVLTLTFLAGIAATVLQVRWGDDTQ